MHERVGQAASLRRLVNAPADQFKQTHLRRLATGAQDDILPRYGETQ
jgi:hypothetical protein